MKAYVWSGGVGVGRIYSVSVVYERPCTCVIEPLFSLVFVLVSVSLSNGAYFHGLGGKARRRAHRVKSRQVRTTTRVAPLCLLRLSRCSTTHPNATTCFEETLLGWRDTQHDAR